MSREEIAKSVLCCILNGPVGNFYYERAANSMSGCSYDEIKNRQEVVKEKLDNMPKTLSNLAVQYADELIGALK